MLTLITPRAELRDLVGQGLTGTFDTEQETERRLLEVQLNIVRATANFGPVLLLAPDEATRSAVTERCQEFQICGLLRSDRLRVKVVPHDGLWIRDFGPQIEALQDSAYVVHWRYFDIRAQTAKREKLEELESARLKLLETREQDDQSDMLAREMTPDSRKAVASMIDDKLYLLRQYSEILEEASPQRSNDEDSAFDIADAVLANPDFHYKNSALALDGGNLLKLEDGRCLTTRVLLARNKFQTIDVKEELARVGGCKEVIYLDALPGGVIEHIDLFVLPVSGKRILMASYDLANPFAEKYWATLKGAERDLAMEAALVMEANAERLQRLGYQVTRVVSPFPRIPENGRTFYPSMLNALVREDRDGQKQILLPFYKNYETDIQAAALKQIADAFGRKAEIVNIEATVAAKAQGGLHCLTLTAPLPLSVFASGAGAQRNEALARKEQLDQSATTEAASQIPATGLQGSWAILEERQGPDGNPLAIYPQRIFFGHDEFQRGVFEQMETRGNYAIVRKDGASWTLHFVLPDQNVTAAVAQWISKDEVQLRFGSAERPLVLRRIDSSEASPFKTEKQGSLQMENEPNTRKSPGNESSTCSGQKPAAFERVEP